MTEPFVLKFDDPLLDQLDFKPYRNAMIRRVVPFVPRDEDEQFKEVKTPWGSILTAKAGDMLVSELDAPEDMWPIDANIFDETYIMTGPGLCIKRAVTLIVPLAAVVAGNEDRMIVVHTLEGPETVRAGDFYLARGVKGEIWPYPNEKVHKTMRPAE